MKTQISFKIKVVRHVDSGLSLKVSANGEVIYQSADVIGDYLDIKKTIHLPARFDFEIGNKSPTDTQIASDGHIVADKAFVLETITLDGFELDSWKLPNSHVFLECLDGEKIPGNWWAHNGIARVVFDRDDPVIWMLDHPEILEMPPKKG